MRRWAHWHLLFPKTTDIKYLSRRNVKTIASWHFFHTSCSLLNDVPGRCPVHSDDSKAWWRFRPNNPSVSCLCVRDAGCYLASLSVQMLSMKKLPQRLISSSTTYVGLSYLLNCYLLTYLLPVMGPAVYYAAKTMLLSTSALHVEAFNIAKMFWGWMANSSNSVCSS